MGANKNSIAIIGENTPGYTQGYFVYDSKKAGSVTVSHLRFGPDPIRSTYLISKASFIGCHQFAFLERMDVLAAADQGATFLLNAPYAPDEVWNHLPRKVQQQILDKGLRLFVIDAYKVAREAGMGGRINTVMQTCFFAVSGVLPHDEAIAAIKAAIQDTYGKRGEAIVRNNFAAVDTTLAHLHEVTIPASATSTIDVLPPVPSHAPAFVRDVLGTLIAGHGDSLPTSALPPDGTFPTATAKWEKRNMAQEIPVWDEDLCIQCGKCVLVCPHAVIRAKVYEPSHLGDAPASFKSAAPRWRGLEAMRYTLQVAPEDCTGCSLCVEVCPAKSKSEVRHKAINMSPQPPIRDAEATNWDFFLALPEFDRDRLTHAQVKDAQLLEPLFEFSGACAGCGETPYIKLLTQLFGDRLLIANATGCSSIYGGNLPTTPYTSNAEGRGPAWSNSLFEDNAEFGLGMRLALDKRVDYARELIRRLASQIGERLVSEILEADQATEAGIASQRQRVAEVKRLIAGLTSNDARDLIAIADGLVRKSVWLVGGDGWAYDIGFGGLDHVLGSGMNVNVLVLDTEVYSNTGGQMSKSTPRGAVAKFAAGGKQTGKKDLAMEAISYGSVYVARVAMGGNDSHTVHAFLEAEAHDGPSLILAYSHCIAHGYDMAFGIEPAEDRGAFRLLAADAIQPGAAKGRQESLPARLQGAEHSAQAIRLSGSALHDAGAQQSGSGARIAADGAGRCRAPMACVCKPRRDGRPGSRIAGSCRRSRDRYGRDGERRQAMIDLTTKYLGLSLEESHRRFGLAAVRFARQVFGVSKITESPRSCCRRCSKSSSLWKAKRWRRISSRGAESFAESLNYFPDLTTYNLGPDGYLELIRKAKASVSIPVIGSLNGVSTGGWIRYAREMEQAGADAIELNLYSIVTDPGTQRRPRRAGLRRAGPGGETKCTDSRRGEAVAILQCSRKYGKTTRCRRCECAGVVQSLLSAGFGSRTARSRAEPDSEQPAGIAASAALGGDHLWPRRRRPGDHRRRP